MAMLWARRVSCDSASRKTFTVRRSWKLSAKNCPSANLDRRVKRLEIVSFGPDFGSITLEFERDAATGVVQGR
jgi:hypothetical protein